ncbi:MAG: CADD family putative folate metabolism protein [Oscillatoriales cyanobacterium RM1_1_9]|nr:CADD family putative folate metabolism protein [Oscillatoriales cyanobacterium SM2_3_0]NJO47100.1 CADD family putative folate metabolism protein [Oscillatoriales cyanobacterium RM2_1_1]NJO71062.1 CADD family putative folate metabolism protein [Oscillatoriales cyanobacterium RM1_1_9]
MLTHETLTTESEFLGQLDAVIEQHHLLKHPFYQLWNAGKLSLKMLQEYAREYYLQVHHFPTYVSATHAACDDLEIRRMLLENLIEEERGATNHPELWLRFAEGLGVDRQTVLQHQPLAKTQASVQILKGLARSENPAVGLAALYAYESQIPEVSTTKIAGLKAFYDVDSERALAFFQVHETADTIHSQMTRVALVKLCQTEATKHDALATTEQAVTGLNLLLDGVYEAYC